MDLKSIEKKQAMLPPIDKSAGNYNNFDEEDRSGEDSSDKNSARKKSEGKQR